MLANALDIISMKAVLLTRLLCKKDFNNGRRKPELKRYLDRLNKNGTVLYSKHLTLKEVTGYAGDDSS
jgi:hypothetical protein